MTDDAQFYEEPAYRRAPDPQQSAGLTGFVLKIGLASDEQGASRVLLVIAGLAILTAVFVFYRSRIPEPVLPEGAVIVEGGGPPRLEKPIY